MDGTELLAAGVWIYAVIAAMALAGLVLLRSMFVPGPLHLTRREQLLSDDQKRLYQALQVWAGDRWQIFCKVPVVELVRPRNDVPLRRSWFESLSQHQVDFVLCDPLTTRIGVAINLAGGSGRGGSAAVEFVGDVLQRANVPWVALPVKPRYSADEIQRLLAPRLG